MTEELKEHPLVEQLTIETGEADLQGSVEAVCAALEDRGSKALADAVRVALGQEVTDILAQRMVFEFDDTPDLVSHEVFEKSFTLLKEITNRIQDPYNCRAEFRQWLAKSLMKSVEARKQWLRDIGISDTTIGQIDASGADQMASTSIFDGIRNFELDLIKLLVAFCMESNITNDSLVSDIRVVQKYCAQQGWWK